MLAGACMALLVGSAGAGSPGPLKIGFLMDLSSGSSEVYEDRKRGFDLAVVHINDGGGVLGRPMTTAVGDTGLRPTAAACSARRKTGCALKKGADMSRNVAICQDLVEICHNHI